MGSRLLWAVVFGFLSGVFARSTLSIGLSYAALVLMLGCACILASLLDQPRSRNLLVIAVGLAACACGIVRMDSSVLTGEPTLTAHLGARVVLEGSVAADPDVRDTGVRVMMQVRTISIGSTTVTAHSRVLVEAPAHTALTHGDVIRATGTMSLPKAFDTEGGRQFDYPDYLGVQGIAYVLSFARVEVLDPGAGSPLTLVFAIKHRYLAGLEAVLPEPQAGLAAGITVGDKRSIGPELSAEFQRVSLMQLVVLSGYNITVVANAAAQILSGASRYMRFGSGIAVVAFFIAISGGASSAMRAGLMALLSMYARMTRRTYDSLRALGCVAFVMIMWNPFTLCFDPGFQLSALAMWGLSVFTPPISRKLRWITERFALQEIVSSTLATQLAVLPLLLYQDGTLSIVSVPANVLAMLPIPFAMLASCIAALGGSLAGPLAVAIALPAYVLLSVVIGVAHVFASLPLSSVTIGVFGFGWVAATYVALLCISFYLGRGKAEADMHSVADQTSPSPESIT